MKPNAILPVFLSVLILLLTNNHLTASPYYWSETDTLATPVFHKAFILTEGAEIVVEVSYLDPGAKAVMHLLRQERRGKHSEVASSDASSATCQGDGICLAYRNNSNTEERLVLVVRAADNAYGGQGGTYFRIEARHNGGFQDWGKHELGGYIVEMAVDARDTVETVLVNDGAGATLLMRLENQDGQYRFADWDIHTAGVGQAAKLTSPSTGRQLFVIGTLSGDTQSGPVRLIRNDAAHGDADRDGLGNRLEQDIGTCPFPPSALPQDGPNPCDELPPDVNPVDSDRDGITDEHELLGNDDGVWPPLLLPLWGANPLHKDMFVEVDVLSGQMNSFGEAAAIFAAGRFKNLAKQDNPDGLPGINVHFDLMVPCTTEDPPIGGDGISSVCGQFGGANTVAAFNCAGLSNDGGNMNANRRGTFRWGLRANTNAGNAPSPGYVSCHNGSGRVVSHELGHNLGLSHSGVLWSGDANTKPNYPSIMSYTYQNSSTFGFSDGSRDILPLDPLNVAEKNAYPAGVNTAFMGVSPYYYKLRTEPSGATSVDWNRDGDFDHSVRANVCCEPRRSDYGGQDIPVRQGNERLPNILTNTTPTGAILTTRHDEEFSSFRSFVIALHPITDRLVYVSSDLRVGGWSNLRRVGLGLNVAVKHSRQCEPEAVEFCSKRSCRVAVFGCTDRDQIQVTLMNGQGAIESPLDGASFPWLELTNLMLSRGVSATTLGGTLYFVARNHAAEGTDWLWLAAIDHDLNFHPWRLVRLANSQKVESAFVTPALTAGPDGKLYLAVRQKDDTKPRAGQIDIYHFTPRGNGDPLAGSWQHLDASRWQSVPRDMRNQCEVGGKIGMVYSKHRDGRGDFLASQNGALWIWYMGQAEDPGDSCWNGTNLFYRTTFGRFNAVDDMFNMGTWWTSSLASWNGPPQDTGVALVNRDEFLSAFAVERGGKIFHIPYADGVAPLTRLINDYDDEKHISRALCDTLRSPVWCGPP